MAISNKWLIAPKYAESSQTTQYTATNCKAIIDKFTATNLSAANVSITINIVPSGGTPGASNKIVDTRTLGSKETYTLPEVVGHYLDPGASISTIASAASSIVIFSSGRELT